MALSSPFFNQLHHHSNLQSFCPRKRPSALSSISFHLFTYSISKYQLHPRFFTVRADINHAYAENHTSNDVHVNYAASKTKPLSNGEEASSWAILQTPGVEMVEKTPTTTHGRSVDEVRDAKKLSEYKNSRYDFDSRRRSKMGGFVSGISPPSSKEEKLLSEISKITGMTGLQFKKGNDNRMGGEKLGRGKNKKVNSPEFQFRIGLDMCSKRGDILGAIRLFELARREGFKMDQYHYTVLLYLCSSAAMGVVQPGKSGSSGRSLNILKVSDGESSVGVAGGMGKKNSDQLFSGSRTPDLGNDSDENHHFLGFKNASSLSLSVLNHLKGGDSNESGAKDGENAIHDEGNILFGENIQKYALQKGFEIYERLCLDEVQMNEATLTSVARLAASVGNGDIAFDMVKQMKLLGLSPRLRSYGPALSAFCNTGDIEKAFSVETHMLENGINPEEPELEALLRVSVEAGKDDKVYDLLHKLRKTVRKVSPSTADLVIKWFTSEPASRVGKRKWNKELIQEAMENGGGGWHGQGWLKRGRWIISQADVEPNGLCKCCGEKLALIDLDPTETENFAESVASLAIQRERNSSFQKFQKWLDYYGPFEAIVDAANVGLFKEKRLVPSKINAVVNGIRQKLPSKRWPLIILHNQRISGYKMGERVNKTLIEKWKNGDAVYATPTGSNDDWYWLYAAIKFKCFLVTNDEMRDHTFQLLGNDFFPKWKERHQVHFSFSDTGPQFHMPLPYTVAIQESENGHWHLPVMSEKNPDGKTTWLCITRHASDKLKHECFAVHQGSETATQTQTRASPVISSHQDHTKTLASEMHKKLRDVFSSTVFMNHHHTILPQIEAAENLGDCPLDFQI